MFEAEDDYLSVGTHIACASVTTRKNEVTVSAVGIGL